MKCIIRLIQYDLMCLFIYMKTIYIQYRYNCTCVAVVVLEASFNNIDILLYMYLHLTSNKWCRTSVSSPSQRFWTTFCQSHHCFLDFQLRDIYWTSSYLVQSERPRRSCEVFLLVAVVLLQQHPGNYDDRVGEARLQHLWGTGQHRMQIDRRRKQTKTHEALHLGPETNQPVDGDPPTRFRHAETGNMRFRFIHLADLLPTLPSCPPHLTQSRRGCRV